MPRAGRFLATVTACLAACACGSQEPATPFAPTDPAGALFAPDHVLQVSLEMAPQDWDAMRRRTREWWDIAAVDGRACLLQPFVKPYPWYEAAITVDGIRRERVTVRKKGFLGSKSETRPALKIHFGDLLEGQTLHGLARLTLNNAEQDPTLVRQCLAYRVFEKAGVPVPWCNFARVRVNGRDLGLYVNIESVDRRFVRRHFERDDGDLWEGEWSDFDPTWIDTFEKKGEVPEDDQRKVDRSSLAELAQAVSPLSPWSRVRDELEKKIDLDEFMSFWAAEKVLEHWDGYTNNLNNFFVYRDPASNRFVFMPWGTDQVSIPDPFATVFPPVSVYSKAAIPNRLYAEPEARERYASALRDVLDRAFDERTLLAEVDRMQALVAPQLANADPEPVAEQAQAVGEFRQWIRERRSVLLNDLRDGPPEWREPRKASFCVDLAGELEGSFATTFGTNTMPDIYRVGNGTLAGVYRKATVAVRRVGSQAGYDKNAQQDPWAVVDINAEATNGIYYNIWIGVNPASFKDGSTGKFEDPFAWGGVGSWNPQTRQWTYLGGFVSGTLELTRAGLASGAPVSGRFKARVIKW